MSTARSIMQRLAVSVGLAGLAGVFAAALDAAWARGAAQDVSFLSLWLANTGLLAPLAVLIGGFVAAASLFFHGARRISFRGYLAKLEERDPEQRAYASALGVGVAVGAIVWLVCSANLGTEILTYAKPSRAAGLALVLASVLLAVWIAALVFGAARLVAPKLASRSPDPRVALVLGLVLFVIVLGYAIGTGTTSGSGGMLAVFGVFKRPELDLRAPVLLALIFGGTYLALPLAAKLPWWPLLVAGLLPLVATLHSRSSAFEERRVALAIERGAPLGKTALALLRRVSDGDRDGFSSHFGGGDCDDADPAKNPAAEDVPGNGVDEDCSGKDDRALILDKPAAKAPADRRAWIHERLPEKLNVLLITVDTLRYDLGYMGYARPISPNIDALAKKSVVFEKAYALASYTSKSLAPMLIGKYASETHRGWSHFNRFGSEDLFIQERVQKAGIRTTSVQGYWYFFNKGYGFERGFDIVNHTAAPKVVVMKDDRSVTADKIADATIEELSKPELENRRFFLWAHIVDPHVDYVRHDGFDFGSGQRERYDSELAFTDHHVGRILDFVEKSGLAERTAIIFTSDHGEAFGEHGMIRHGFELWEVLVRVPLIVHVPGAKPHRIRVRRSIIDIAPTILDLYRINPVAGEGDDFMSGSSLLADLFLPPGYEPAPRIVFVDMAAGPHNAERQAFIENSLKLITSSGRPLGLYDLEKDPQEEKDLLEDAELREKVMERFKAFRRDLREVKVRPQ